jgi:anti-sigma factor RsiW
MVDHLSRDVLARYAARTLSVREILLADKHLGECTACRATLLKLAPGPSAKRVVGAVRQAAEHVSYEQIEAYIDRRLTDDGRAKVDRHVASCPRCARELADMRAFASALSTPVAQAAPAASPAARGESRGFFGAVAAWLGGTPGVRAAAAVLVATVAITLIMQEAGNRGRPGTDIDFAISRDAIDQRELTVERRAFDQSAFASVAAASTAFADAFRAGDFAKAASELHTKANQGDRDAQVALALMYIAGEGVSRDIIRAERLLRQAADQKLASAAHNLGVLNARGLLSGANDEQAQRWFAEAEKLRDR